jgi:hypothetical protein
VALVSSDLRIAGHNDARACVAKQLAKDEGDRYRSV